MIFAGKIPEQNDPPRNARDSPNAFRRKQRLSSRQTRQAYWPGYNSDQRDSNKICEEWCEYLKQMPVLNTYLVDSHFKFERKVDSRINKEDATAFGSYRKMHRSRPLPPRLDYRVPCPSIHCWENFLKTYRNTLKPIMKKKMNMKMIYLHARRNQLILLFCHWRLHWCGKLFKLFLYNKSGIVVTLSYYDWTFTKSSRKLASIRHDNAWLQKWYLISFKSANFRKRNL